ncbi:MAG TPA: RyR domain-containing protein [Xanthobacteraceae bacterium]|nr:RyR domain-containing protein [Xanthobacteraceae bacterium]
MQIVMAMQDHPDRPPMLSFTVSNQEAERIKRWRKAKPDLDLIVEIAVLVCEGDEALPSADKIEPWRKTCSGPQVAIVLREDADAITAMLALRRPGNPLGTESIPVLVHQSKEDRLLARLGTAQVEYRDLTRLPPNPSATNRSPHCGHGMTCRKICVTRTARQSKHAPVMLAAIGRALAPVASGADPAPLSSDEMEVLTKIEHRRWIAERIAHGWRYGPMRDDRQMLHPDMVPYESLSNAAREKDRNAVRVLLSALEAQGQVLARVSRPTT